MLCLMYNAFESWQGPLHGRTLHGKCGPATPRSRPRSATVHFMHSKICRCQRQEVNLMLGPSQYNVPSQCLSEIKAAVSKSLPSKLNLSHEHECPPLKATKRPALVCALPSKALLDHWLMQSITYDARYAPMHYLPFHATALLLSRATYRSLSPKEHLEQDWSVVPMSFTIAVLIKLTGATPLQHH